MYASDTLYHLVGAASPDDDDANFQVLRSVLRSMEVWAKPVAGQRDKVRFGVDPDRQSVDGEPIQQNKACFCDIPLQHLSLHAKKYGRLGVGVDRVTVAKWGGRPVAYVPLVPHDPTVGNNDYTKRALGIWRDLDIHFPQHEGVRSRPWGARAKDAADAAWLARDYVTQTLAFVKEFDASLPLDHPFNFYMEREWCKLSGLDLHASIREIVAPERFHEELRFEFPELRHVPIVAIPEIRRSALLSARIHVSRQFSEEVLDLLFVASSRESPRRRIALAARLLAHEHHSALVELMATGHFSSAAALLRPIAEASACAYWVTYVASKEIVGRLLLRKSEVEFYADTPSLDDMIRYLSSPQIGLPDIERLFNLVKQQSPLWRRFHKYTHGGMLQLAPKSELASLDEEDNLLHLMQADAFLLPALGLGTLYENSEAIRECLDRHRARILCEVVGFGGDDVRGPWPGLPQPPALDD